MLNGKRVPKRKSYLACYYHYHHTACFKKRGLTKRNVLHELYHHIVACGLPSAEARGRRGEMSSTEEERQARMYSYSVVRKAKS